MPGFHEKRRGWLEEADPVEYRKGRLRDRNTGRFMATSGSSFERLAERDMIADARRHLTCEICGRSFSAPRVDARYCGSACRQKAYRRRREKSA